MCSDDWSLYVYWVVPHAPQLHGFIQCTHYVEGIMALCWRRNQEPVKTFGLFSFLQSDINKERRSRPRDGWLLLPGELQLPQAQTFLYPPEAGCLITRLSFLCFIFCFFFLLRHVLVCVRVCVSVHLHTCACMWRPQVNVRRFPLSLCTSFYETWSSHWMWSSECQ